MQTDGELVARVMHDRFHVPWLACAAVPTQTAALGRSDSPPPSLPRGLPTDRMKNKPNVSDAERKGDMIWNQHNFIYNSHLQRVCDLLPFFCQICQLITIITIWGLGFHSLTTRAAHPHTDIRADKLWSISSGEGSQKGKWGTFGLGWFFFVGPTYPNAESTGKKWDLWRLTENKCIKESEKHHVLLSYQHHCHFGHNWTVTAWSYFQHAHITHNTLVHHTLSGSSQSDSAF